MEYMQYVGEDFLDKDALQDLNIDGEYTQRMNAESLAIIVNTAIEKERPNVSEDRISEIQKEARIASQIDMSRLVEVATKSFDLSEEELASRAEQIIGISLEELREKQTNDALEKNERLNTPQTFPSAEENEQLRNAITGETLRDLSQSSILDRISDNYSGIQDLLLNRGAAEEQIGNGSGGPAAPEGTTISQAEPQGSVVENTKDIPRT